MRHLPSLRHRANLAAMVALTATITSAATTVAAPIRQDVRRDGVVKIASVYPIAETIRRLKADIAGKGITFFHEIDQQALARAAGVDLPPSTLLVFGNPALGSQFVAARPEAGLDWPVRLLVSADRKGRVSLSYTDFRWIARRHGITTRNREFDMASKVIASIADSVRTK